MERTFAVWTRFEGKSSWAASAAAKTSAVRRPGVGAGFAGSRLVRLETEPEGAKSFAALPRGLGLGGPPTSAIGTGAVMSCFATGTARFEGRPRLAGALAGSLAGA